MTRVGRARRARRLCERLAADVEALAPGGIGRWGPTWDIVADADVTFVVALTGWEAAGEEEDRAQVRAAYYAVLDAWQEAVRQFQGRRAQT